MSRLQKKCFLASTGLHGLLVLVILFGTAFFGGSKQLPPVSRLNVVPAKLVENALAGGGGNPKLERTDEQVKGNSLNPADTAPEVQPPQPQPQPQPPPPRPQAQEVKAREPQPQVRTEPVRQPTKPPVVKPPDNPRPNATEKTSDQKPALDLTPVVRDPYAKERAAAQAKAREAAQKQAEYRRELAAKLGDVSKGLKAGFEGGTKVDVGGPGGEAYADYAFLVQTVYDSAWQVQPDLASQEFVVPVEVVIARDGHIVSQRILNRSGNFAMDRSVQRALDKVKAIGLRPFPPGSRDDEKTFNIKFNLKARKLTG